MERLRNSRSAFILIAALILAACSLINQAQGSPTPSPTFSVTATHAAASQNENGWRISALKPVSVYSGPGGDYPPAGMLLARGNTKDLKSSVGSWMNNVSQIDWSPDGQQVLVTVADIAGDCQPARATEWRLDI
ncbi:MAG TPA: hypothetical protein VLA49_16055, partial [Anaerolineales bacterium]|nr:hypothetical protein [Anaerolineales bacterium]